MWKLEELREFLEKVIKDNKESEYYQSEEITVNKIMAQQKVADAEFILTNFLDGESDVGVESQVIKKPIKFTECYIGQKMGFDVIINTEVPPNEIHFIDENGNEVLKVRNVSL